MGAILYEMVTGTVPFKGDTALSVALKHKSQLPLDPRKFNPEVSDDLARLILICMEKDRGRRYQTAEALLDDLRNIEEGFPLGTKIRPRRETFVATLIRKRLFIPALVVALAVVAMAIWQLLPNKGTAYPPKIENSIAVISFENQSGDQTLDIYQKSIPNLLITSLEQTDFLHVATWERLRDLIKQMGKDDVEIITSDLGFEACRREGIEVIVLGSYTKIGETFSTDIKVLDVDTKRLLKAASSRGEGVDSIFDQIDELSKQISEGMGISVQKIEAAKWVNIKDLTTSSMEAYNYFIRGVEEAGKIQDENAIRFLQKAIELDPDFALAYYFLGDTYGELGEIGKATECFKKAKEFSNTVTGKEKLYIERNYALYIERDFEKAHKINQQIIDKYYTSDVATRYMVARSFDLRGIYNQAIEEYHKILHLDPEHTWAHICLAYIYAELLDREKAIEFARRSASLNPGDPNPLDSLAEIYLRLGELDPAIAKYKEVLEVASDFHYPKWTLAYVYALKEEYLETLKWINLYIADVSLAVQKAEGYWWKGFYYGWLGNSKLSFECLAKATKLAEESENLEIKYLTEWVKGWIYLDREEFENARKHFQAWIDFISEDRLPVRIPRSNKPQSFIFGLLDLKEGNASSAESRLTEMESLLSEFPLDSMHASKELVKYYHELFRAEIQLIKDYVDEAITISKKTSIFMIPSVGRGMGWIAWYNIPFQRDVLARAYQQKGNLDKAIDWYEQHIVIDPKTTDRRLIPPKYHYKLAVLYEEKGRKSKAIAQYEKFLDIWKNADPGIAEVEDAKKRLAVLKSQ